MEKTEPTRVHIDTLEVRIFGVTANLPIEVEDKITEVLTDAVEQVKRDLQPLGLQVESDF